MALKGPAFLALWNDIDAARDAEYNCWHSFEHVPERVGIAGILSGRRYVARGRCEARYFTLYELESLAALEGPEYLDVVERPTEWSFAMRPSFRNFQRLPCTTLRSEGIGVASAIATMRLGDCPGVTEDTGALVASALQPFLGCGRLIAFHAGAVDTAARFHMLNAASQTPEQMGSRFVILVEAIDAVTLDGALSDVVTALTKAFRPSQQLNALSYQLDLIVDRSQLNRPAAGRQPPRPDLRALWLAKASQTSASQTSTPQNDEA